MTTTYSILATITLQHDYYADGRSIDFEIVPTAATASALKGAGILSKMVGNALILLIKVHDSGPDEGAVFIDLPMNLKMSFYLQLNNTSFINFTNVSYQPGSIFYFSNLSTTRVDDTLYLNNRVPLFNGLLAYAIGDLVSDAAGDVFEAIKPVPAGSHATTDALFWTKRANRQYVNGSDLLTLSDGNLIVDTSDAPAKVFDITILGLNPFTLVYDVPVGLPQQQNFTEDMTSIVVNLQDAPPAKYKVLVNGLEPYCYKDQTASYSRVFGIIELFNLFSPLNDFGLLDSSKIPKGLDLVIRFANRLALWKYITKTTQVTGIEIPSVPNAFLPGPHPKEFISSAPMLMNEAPLKTLQLMKGATILASKLANPPPDRISTFRDIDNNQYFCAEMFLNY